MHPRKIITVRIFATLALAVGFSVWPGRASAQTFKLLHAFAPTVNGTNADGTLPLGGVVLSGNMLYGTTYNGGAYSNGTVYAVNVDGTGFTNLHVFSLRSGLAHTNTDGGWPACTLIVSGQKLFGTTGLAGPTRFGTVFALNTDGTGFTNLHQFSGSTDGNSTVAGVTLLGGRLYGASQSGGTNGYGTLFSMNPDGSAYTNLHSFGGTLSGGASDGIQPLASLVALGTNLFGSCSGGGGTNGTVFRVNPDGGGFTNLHVFSALVSGTNSDGAKPLAGGLTLNGTNLFGTTQMGGGAGNGVLYRLNPDGSGFTNLHSFSATSSLTNTDGVSPFGPLFSSGNTLYGAASGGGVSSNGTVFVVNTDGSGFKVLYQFSSKINSTNADGAVPVSVILSSNTLYGVTHSGGIGGNGTVFSLFVPPALSLGTDGGNAILTWPTNADGFALQSSSNLDSTAIWSPVAPDPVNLNGQYTVTNSASSPQMHFRLAR